MKTDDKDQSKKTDMVSRKSDPNTPFTVHKSEPQQPSQADALNSEVADEEAELTAVQDALKERQRAIAEKKEKAAEIARQEKTAEWRTKMDDAADYAEIAKTSTDPDRAKEYHRRAKMAAREASLLAKELNLEVPAEFTEPEAPKRLLPLSSNKALQIMGGLFLLCVLLTYIFGHPLEADPMNAIGQSMMKNAPIRALLSFTLTFLTVLVATALIRIVFPQFYRIWHNGIDSERSLESLLNEAPAWAVLLSLLGLFYTFMQLFASFYQALYA
jgi:hypothetical protein